MGSPTTMQATTPPTYTPTISPTYLPTGSPTRSPLPSKAPSKDLGPSLCFPGDSIVKIKSKGEIKMEQLNIGDIVHVGNGRYEKVYSFGHYDPHSPPQEYFEIVTSNSTLKVSPDHMVLSKSR